MDNPRKTQVLKEFRLYFRLFNAYNCDNFRQGDWRHNCRSVFDAFSTSFIVALMSSHIMFDIWYIVDHHTDLKKVVTIFPLTISTLQIWLSFFAMLMKNATITEMIDRMQSVVDQRKLFCPNLSYLMHLIDNYFGWQLGCSINEQSFQLYERVERKHVFGHSTPVKLSFGAVFVVFVLTAMQPVLFGIFGYPLPQQWILPVETQ